MNNYDPSAFLMGSGGKSAKFEAVGATITGSVTEKPEVRQQTDMENGAPLMWDNGDPKLQLVVTLATELRDAADPDDDGIRKLYVKGSKDRASKSMHAAVLGACIAAGAKQGLEVGGRLTVTYVGNGQPKTRGYNAPKQYEASYVLASTEFLGTDTPAPAAAPAAAAAPQTPAASATGGAPDAVTTARQLISAGVADGLIASTTGLDMAVIAGLRAQPAA